MQLDVEVSPPASAIQHQATRNKFCVLCQEIIEKVRASAKTKQTHGKNNIILRILASYDAKIRPP